MATWKKVIVSGSAAELLNITASAANITTLNVTAGSGSFSGSFQGDGSGLTGVPATGVVLAPISGGLGIESFNYVGQASASVVLDTGSAHFTAGVRGKISTSNTTGNGGITSTYDSATGAFSSSLTNPTTQIGNTQITLTQTSSVIDGLTLTGVVATGSFSGSFVGTTDLPDLTAGTGISTFTYDGATTATVEVSGAAQLTDNAITKWNDTDGKFVDSSLTDNGTAITGTTSIQLTGASSNLSGSFSGSFAGDGANLTNVPATGINLSPLTGGAGIVPFTYSGSAAQFVAIDTASVQNYMIANPFISMSDGSTADVVNLGETFTIQGTANEVSTAITNNTVTIGLPNDVTIAGDLTVNNDLTVLGTASFQNTTNLEVSDRFILLASGSNTTGDGGFVVQQSTQDVGEVFGFHAAGGSQRWGIATGFTASNSSFTPDAFMAAVVVSNSLDPNDAPAVYDRPGNIYVSSGDGSIYIYS